MHARFALRILTITAVIIGITLSLLPTPAGNVTEASRSFAISDVTLFDGEVWHERATVIVRDGRIDAVTADASAASGLNTIDGSGKTLIPGLIDAHTHVFGNALAAAPRFGVTTVIDLFTTPALIAKAADERASFEPTTQAALYSAGMLATVDGGHGTQFGLGVETLSSPEQASDWVARRLAEGSDYIKLVYMPHQSRLPSLDRATATAVIDAAHAAGVKAFAHISDQRSAEELVDAGVDALVHIFADSEVSDAFIAKALQQGLVIIPTLSILAVVDGQSPGQDLLADSRLTERLSAADRSALQGSFGERPPGFSLETAQHNVRRLHAAGVTVLAGSDAPNPGTAHGVTLHREIEYLHASGLSSGDALRAATALPAALVGDERRGVIRRGAHADLVLLNGDPREDITDTRAIVGVWRNGSRIEAQAKAPVVAFSLPAQLGDFESDLSAPTGLNWSSTSDAMAGGKSSATLQLARPGAADSAGAMRVDATVDAAYAYPWAGAWLGLNEANEAASVAAFNAVRFSVRGDPGNYRLMLFSSTMTGVPPTRYFEVSSDWQDVTLRFDTLEGFDRQQFTGMALVTPMLAGQYSFTIDAVRLVSVNDE